MMEKDNAAMEDQRLKKSFELGLDVWKARKAFFTRPQILERRKFGHLVVH